jgi:serine/threonine protein kinase
MLDDRLYFVGELIDGHNLRYVLRQRGVLRPEEVAQIGAAVADALGAAHALGIVHRDVKPHNIMMTTDGAPKLLDFGIARGIGIDMNQSITASGMMVGTPEYMSPEQFEGKRVDGKSDIYSLGVVLYELLTGAPPFAGDTPVTLGMKHRSDLPPAIRSVRPSVPAWLERVVLRCLEKEPTNRFITAAELADELLKPRRGERKVQTLPTGDQIVEDDSESERWALVISSADERKNWAHAMALRFGDRYYRLDEIANLRGRWFYRFSNWPSEQIFRKVIDYEEDAAARLAHASSLGGKLKKWLRK